METYELKAVRGDSWARRFRFRTTNVDGTPGAYYDFTGCTFRAQIRPDTYGSTIFTDMTVNVPAPVTDGYVDVYLTKEQASKIPSYAEGAVGGWDLELTDSNGVRTTLVGGPVTLTGDYTHD